MFGARCFWCRVKLPLKEIEVDRIVPGHKGGRYVHGNIVPSCSRCNKHSRVNYAKKQQVLQGRKVAR